MESSRLTSSNVYEPLCKKALIFMPSFFSVRDNSLCCCVARSMEGSHNAAYYPPEPDLAKSDGSFGAIGLNTEGKNMPLLLLSMLFMQMLFVFRRSQHNDGKRLTFCTYKFTPSRFTTTRSVAKGVGY